MYTYNALVTKVYDGGTVIANIDLGLNVILKKQKIRLAGITTPKIRGEEREDGILARNYLRELILGKEILIKTVKDKKEKYGKYIGHLYVSEQSLSINELLVQKGHAVFIKYA